jgi:4-hydroxy-3-methylbut-2-en-1-yl diphosphate reductase
MSYLQCAPPLHDASREMVLSETKPSLHVLLAAPRGFCAGVRRAINAVAAALELHGAPVYVRRAIVHNLVVVRSLEAQGAIFVEELEQVPEGAVVVLSAHGVSPGVREEADRRNLITYDAVCPLVAKVHGEVARHSRRGRHVVLVGHRGHPEIVGTLGYVPDGGATLVQTASDVLALDLPDDAPVGYAVQTTYSVEEAADVVQALEGRFKNLASPPRSDICYATTNRQAAVRRIAPLADAMIVAGEHFSSNACRLAEVARASGCPSVQLIADSSKLDWRQLPERGTIGMTAAASTPEIVVTGILAELRTRYRVDLEEIGSAEENTVFKPVRIG